jgi:hypothetical protein
VVDNELDLWDVQPSARHIRRYQQFPLIRLEEREGRHPLLLRLHAVQGGGNKTQLSERTIQQFRRLAGLGEHHDGVGGPFSANIKHDLDEEAVFGLERGEDKALVELGDGGGVGEGGALPDVRVVGAGQDGLVDEGGGGGREEKGLTIQGNGGENRRQLIVESTYMIRQS